MPGIILGLLFLFFVRVLFLIFKASSQVNIQLNQMNRILQESNKVVSQNLEYLKRI